MYGFKTRRMLGLFADAAGAPALRAWEPSPSAPDDAGTVACYPEYAIARAMMLRRRGTREDMHPRVADLLRLCDALTEAYRTGRLETQGQILRESSLFQATSFGVWALVGRALLRCVTMGVGVTTVLDALGPRCGAFYARVRDLSKVARPLPEDEGVVCGTPFTPMTCEALRTPYLLKWLFARQDTLARPLTPVDGRLLIGDRARWYVPLSARAPQNRRYINLEEHRILQQKRREEHYLMLRLCRKARLLDETRATGRIVHYTLSIQENGEVLMLLRETSDAIQAGVEIVPVGRAEEEDAIPPAAVGPKPDLEALCLREEARVSGRTLRIATAAQRAPPRRTAAVHLFQQRADAPRRAATRQQQQANGDAGGVIVQTKYDGDRLQAHMAADGTTTLFTRRGVDVSRLYSDIAHALEGSSWWRRNACPCVLDGELIVVDSRTSVPLAWDNEKWRHNHRNAEGERDSPYLRDLGADVPHSAVVMLEYEDTELSLDGEEDDADDGIISFATLGALRYYIANNNPVTLCCFIKENNNTNETQGGDDDARRAACAARCEPKHHAAVCRV